MTRGRRRPKLEGWDGSHLQTVGSTHPQDWVVAVLSTRGSPGQFKFWTFGEIREAIRRELEREIEPWDLASKARAAKDASLKTDRGLRFLDKQGALRHRGVRYYLEIDWAWGEEAHARLREAVLAMARDEAFLSPPSGGGVTKDRDGNLVFHFEVCYRAPSGRTEVGLTISYPHARPVWSGPAKVDRWLDEKSATSGPGPSLQDAGVHPDGSGPASRAKSRSRARKRGT